MGGAHPVHQSERERKRERGRETKRKRERGRETKRKRGRERETKRERGRERQREREGERESVCVACTCKQKVRACSKHSSLSQSAFVIILSMI
jgi:hypothetical protein